MCGSKNVSYMSDEPVCAAVHELRVLVLVVAAPGYQDVARPEPRLAVLRDLSEPLGKRLHVGGGGHLRALVRAPLEGVGR